jgi:hypothetical protein
MSKVAPVSVVPEFVVVDVSSDVVVVVEVVPEAVPLLSEEVVPDAVELLSDDVVPDVI